MTNPLKLACAVGALMIGGSLLWGQVEPVQVPDLPRIDPMPQIETLPRIETLPTIEMKPSIETMPRVETAPRVQPTKPSRVMVPGTPPRAEPEASDCTVREFRCASSCEPLPDQWSSYRACVVDHCGNKEESCIEKLVEGLRNRHAASESTITFKIECDYQYAVRIGFYSQERNLVWTGGHDAYRIDDYETHAYKLRCSSGEKICYGAQASGGSTSWGVGLDGRRSCKNCCAFCGGSSVSYVLK
jgi:hypothetical protein